MGSIYNLFSNEDFKHLKKTLISKELNIQRFIFIYKDKEGLNFEYLSVDDFHSIPKEFFESDVGVVKDFLIEEYQKMLNKFNASLKPYESKRYFKAIYSISEKITLNKL